MITAVDTEGPAARPFAGQSREPTIPPGQLTQEAMVLRAIETTGRAIDSLSGAVKQGRGGPWVVAVLVSLIVSVVVSGGLWGAHMATGDRQILDRLDALEEAQEMGDDHRAWVVQALVALSESKALPPPPQRRFRRRTGRQ